MISEIREEQASVFPHPTDNTPGQRHLLGGRRDNPRRSLLITTSTIMQPRMSHQRKSDALSHSPDSKRRKPGMSQGDTIRVEKECLQKLEQLGFIGTIPKLKSKVSVHRKKTVGWVCIVSRSEEHFLKSYDEFPSLCSYAIWSRVRTLICMWYLFHSFGSYHVVSVKPTSTCFQYPDCQWCVPRE